MRKISNVMRWDKDDLVSGNSMLGQLNPSTELAFRNDHKVNDGFAMGPGWEVQGFPDILKRIDMKVRNRF